MTEKFYFYFEQYSILLVIFGLFWILKDPIIVLGKYLIDTKFSEIATLKEIQMLLDDNNDSNNVILVNQINKVIQKNENIELP